MTRRLFALLALPLLAGCFERDMPEASDGVALFAENCVMCHGPLGRGNGVIAEGLDPKPADLTRIAARAGGTFPRAAVLSKIDGYTKQPQEAQMPEFGLLLKGPTVPVDVGGAQPTPVPRPLAAMAAYLESIQR